MKKVYIVLAILALVGSVLGYLLIPRENEMTLVNYKEQVWDFNKDAYESKDAYVARFGAGDHSVNVVYPLVDIYLQEGNVNEAIVVLETFIAENPDNIAARKQLGTLYQYAQRPSDYLKNLEEIKRLSGNKEVLRDLSDIYSFNEEYGKQAQVMNELIASKQPLEPRQFIELANMQAASQQPLDAIATLNALRAAHPDAVGYDAVRLLTGLLLDVGEKEGALAEAKWWQSKAKDVEEIAQLANILHYKGDAALAERYLEVYGDALFDYPDLAVEKILVQIDRGTEREAFAALNRLNAEGKVPVALIDSYLLLALRYGDEELIADLTARITPDAVEEPQAISLIELAVSSRRRAVLDTIKTQLGTPEYRQAHPIFSLILGLALGEADTEKKIGLFLDGSAVTDPQRVLLARACAAAGKNGCAERLIGELRRGEVDAFRLAAVGSLYLDIRRYEEGLTFVEQYKGENPTTEIAQIWAKLAAANGREEEVMSWLSANEATVSESLLTDIYFLAADRHHRRLALSAAQLLNARANTPESRNYLAHAYLGNGQFAEALKLLREAGELTDEVVDSYLTALIAQAKRDPSYRGELAEFASAQLKSGEVSERRKLALVYALIDGGRVDIAMPYIREFALRSGGNWAYLYAENLDKAGKYEEARQFWMMAAKRPGIGVEEKRSIAFTLLDRGYREDALGLFMELAENAKPEGVDVQQLLYIWGPRLDQPQLEWVYGRAAAASDEKERKTWLKMAEDYASADSIAALADAHPEVLSEPKLLDAYLLAQYEMENHAALDDLLVKIQEGDYPPEAVRRYARFSRDYAMPKRAEEAYRQLLLLDENDEEALREVGVMAYAQANYSWAKAYLGNFLTLRQTATTEDRDAYLAYFYYAEILRREEQYEEAYKYYQAAIDVVMKEQPADRTADMESKAYQSQVWLGNEEGGYAGFREAVARHPEDDVLRADLVSTLIERQRYDDAKAELQLPRPVMGDTAAVEQMNVPSGEFTAYKLLGNRRELLISYNPETTPKPSITENTRAYGWVGYITQGYNQVLVSALPDYTLEVVKRQDGGMTVMARPDEARSSRKAEAQAKLRYELLKARIDLETGEQYAASNRLNKLLPEYPGDSQLLGYTANAENYVGRWQRALRMLRQAAALAPENEDIAILKRDIEKQHAQQIKLDHEWRALGDNDEQITTLSGVVTVSDGMDIGAEVQNNHLSSASVRRADGRVGEFDADKQRGEVFVRQMNEDGTALQGSLFANNDTLGFGGYVDFINWLGISGLALEFHRPYWEFVEGVLDDATRDRAGIHHAARIDRHLTVEADASLNRYNVKREEGVANTVGISATAGYQFREDPDLSVVYGLDAEYDLDHDTNTDASGERYRTFPFRSREVHSLALVGSYRFTPKTYADFLAGYGVDRLGGNGPIGELRLTHEITDDLDVQARAFYGLGAGETEDDVARVGAYLLYRY